MKVMNDGFVYKLLDEEKAKDIFALGLFELYIIWGDDSESLATNWIQLDNAIRSGYDIGIEVGHIGVEQLINITHESSKN
jgi:hypothetical protein